MSLDFQENYIKRNLLKDVSRNQRKKKVIHLIRVF